MTTLEWGLVEAAFGAGVLWVRDKIYRKDLTGIGGKTRVLEAKRVKDIAVQIEINADDADAVRVLARYLRDTV